VVQASRLQNMGKPFELQAGRLHHYPPVQGSARASSSWDYEALAKPLVVRASRLQIAGIALELQARRLHHCEPVQGFARASYD